ncbi:uncharacterized protein HMPREF1541_06885 [Cyphellophora europaea CBS 101466]|uniref:Uncharacterized protein n=1 Tax=Cyphellophora europaea (strain CBS 101466) TaxID=1220924 RepID=W2RSZ6_CYPE1|nr:uncharacterized protein HMPREF1541_06885 [Cyphellophora europaea CBS 101466]ETN38844.1 hypothetical protein HMPREF1541_06885 [Cyphellophora europaea CBS 101466]
MPRLRPISESSLDPANRRSSARARKPTAKLEALTATKFYASDMANPRHDASMSQSPDPSVDSSNLTPVSPLSDAAPAPGQDHTPPSTVSTDQSSISAGYGEGSNAAVPEIDDPVSAIGVGKRGPRRDRKPTQRALEMGESTSTTRRRRRTREEILNTRTSITPSEASPTPEAVPIMLQPSRKQVRRNTKLIDSDDASSVPAEPVQKSEPPISTPRRSDGRSRSAIQDANKTTPSTFESPRRSSRVKNLDANVAEAAASAAHDSKIPDNTESSNQAMAPSTTNDSASDGMNSGLPTSTDRNIRLRFRQPARKLESIDPPDTTSVESPALSSPSTTRRTSRRSTSNPNQARESQSRKRSASPPEEERPQKSMRVTLKVKVPVSKLKQPSKLRHSVIAEHDSEAISPASETMPLPAKHYGAGAQIVRDDSQQANKTSNAIHQRSTKLTVLSIPAKLSRRAQAKVDAKANGRLRQATESANPDMLQNTMYGGASSHYTPSVSMVGPAVGCQLHCLSPRSRTQAYQRMTMSTTESDQEDAAGTDGNFDLEHVVLRKRGSSYCVCTDSSHSHAATTPVSASEENAPQDRQSAKVLQPREPHERQNEDILAAWPENIELPMVMPAVNSSMSAAQARVASLLYKVIPGRVASDETAQDLRTSIRRSSSPVASGDALDRTSNHSTAAPATRAGSSSGRASESHAASSASSSEERARWADQALERTRRVAQEMGITVTPYMEYDQIKKLVQVYQSRAQPSGWSHPHAHSPTFSGNMLQDDSDDRLQQIIGDSYTATLSRNAAGRVRVTTPSRSSNNDAWNEDERSEKEHKTSKIDDKKTGGKELKEVQTRRRKSAQEQSKP